nr:MAG TPA: hypothetical protein [Caudoviricetes sp.]
MLRLVKCLILVGFDDMGYDMGFEGVKLGFCLIFSGKLGSWIFELVCGRISYSSKLKSKHLFEF